MTTPANTPAQNSPIPTLDLNDGRAIPQLGLGIYAMKGEEGSTPSWVPSTMSATACSTPR